MKSTLKLPLLTKIKQIPTLVEYLDPRNYKAVYRLFLRAGIDSDEKPGTYRIAGRKNNIIEQISHYISISDTKIIFTNTENGTLFASLFLYPSPLCRSLKPIVNAGFLLIDPRYRGRGIGAEMSEYIDMYSVQSGYVAHLSRISLDARHAVPFVQRGRTPMGLIPKSLYTKHFGWMPDLIMFNRYQNDISGKVQSLESNQRRLFSPTKRPNNINSSDTETKLKKNVKLNVVEEFTNNCGETMNICNGANLEDEEVQNLFRNAAENGQGFALDEFDDESGRYHCKLIREPKVLVLMKRLERKIVGVLVYGSPVLCRTPGQVATAYVAIHESERRKGNGKILYNYFVRMLTSQKQYNTILFDVFKSDSLVISWLFKEGFDVTGTIKYSGFVSGVGQTDTMVLHKMLETKT